MTIIVLIVGVEFSDAWKMSFSNKKELKYSIVDISFGGFRRMHTIKYTMVIAEIKELPRSSIYDIPWYVLTDYGKTNTHLVCTSSLLM